MSLAQQERIALADLLDQLGPEARTLCEGWTTRDLAAHVVTRDRRPDTMPGLGLRPLRHWTEQVRETYTERPYDELVSLLETRARHLGARTRPVTRPLRRMAAALRRRRVALRHH